MAAKADAIRVGRVKDIMAVRILGISMVWGLDLPYGGPTHSGKSAPFRLKYVYCCKW
jgi:hypothetical protein